MSRSAPQLNIRSAFARDKATALARQTGMTTTQVVEEALRVYRPPLADDGSDLPPAPPGMIRKGPLLVFASRGGPKITTEQLLAAIDEAREERAEMVANPDAY